jgi:rod shape-determining protein MreC
MDLRPERRWRSSDRLDGDRRRPPTSLVVALVLACVSLMVLDVRGGDDSPVEGARRAVGEVLGPVESGTSAALRPITSIPGWFRTRDGMQERIDDLEAENSRLRTEANRADYDRNRLAEYDGLTTAAADLGFAMVPARVIGVGASQSFSSTVTIDAGSDSGLRADQTVLNADGLVGRVLRVTRTTATVLLLVDADSVVGARIGTSMELGSLHGRGAIGDDARLDLELVDEAVVPVAGDPVVTWGSEDGAPYVSGVPIGEVTTVYSSLRDSSQRAVIDPYVDFGALDVVGVVVPSGSDSDRGVIEADGTLQ